MRKTELEEIVSIPVVIPLSFLEVRYLVADTRQGNATRLKIGILGPATNHRIGAKTPSNNSNSPTCSVPYPANPDKYPAKTETLDWQEMHFGIETR